MRGSASKSSGSVGKGSRFAMFVLFGALRTILIDQGCGCLLAAEKRNDELRHMNGSFA